MARESPRLHVRRSQRPGIANDAHRLGAARGLKASLTLPEVTGLPADSGPSPFREDKQYAGIPHKQPRLEPCGRVPIYSARASVDL